MAIERLQAINGNAMHKTIGQLLIKEELITPEQLESALQVQQEKGGKLGEILITQGVVKAEDIAAVYSLSLIHI